MTIATVKETEFTTCHQSLREGQPLLHPAGRGGSGSAPSPSSRRGPIPGTSTNLDVSKKHIGFRSHFPQKETSGGNYGSWLS